LPLEVTTQKAGRKHLSTRR